MKKLSGSGVCLATCPSRSASPDSGLPDDYICLDWASVYNGCDCVDMTLTRLHSVISIVLIG